MLSWLWSLNWVKACPFTASETFGSSFALECEQISFCCCFAFNSVMDVYTEWLSGLANSAFLSLCVSVSLDLCFSSLRPAMQQVLDNVGELPTSAGAKDIDLLFLRGIMESPIVRSLAKVAHTHSSGQAAVSRQTTSQLQAPPTRCSQQCFACSGWGAEVQ